MIQPAVLIQQQESARVLRLFQIVAPILKTHHQCVLKEVKNSTPLARRPRPRLTLRLKNPFSLLAGRNQREMKKQKLRYLNRDKACVMGREIRLLYFISSPSSLMVGFYNLSLNFNYI